MTLTVAALVADVSRRSGEEFVIHGEASVVLRDVTHDSRQVRPSTMFCCVPGDRFDGHDFAGEAVRHGATALLVERVLPLAVTQIVAANVRSAMGIFAAAVHGWPADDLKMVGITGTNGKTTTAHLIAALLRGDGVETEVLGTIQGPRTTPESTDLQRQLAEFRAAGRRAVVMEVTSHALALDRVAGTTFDVSVFTNLSRDHLDFHGTEERYFAAKAKLFAPALSGRAVINRDDVHGRLLIDSAVIECTSFGASDASDVVVTPRHHEFTWRGVRMSVPLGGRFNLMNSIAAATTAVTLGMEPKSVARSLGEVAPVPGRYQVVDQSREPIVVVDYAHDAHSLELVIAATREMIAPTARVILVFGCGGDRDASKRPEMGRVASERADVVFVTSDNPRSESPAAIAEEIVGGVQPEHGFRVIVELDRRAAIRAAIAVAAPGDVVIVAGKGHENTQTIGATVVPFDDVEVSRELLGVGA
ncbi:MAG: UDP-N-acetylmuramoyl-L-alanyl-D-glutamate--2,6-diaminopimelate ligase [Ilumatobacteraceae bacterium]